MSSEAAASFYEDLTIASPSLLRRWSHRNRYRAALSAVEILPDFAIADYGAGDGYLLNGIAERCPGTELWAFDPDPIFEGIRAGTGIRVADTPDQLPTAHFDRVFCTEVLEHLEPREIERALVNIRRILKPGGMAVVTIPVEIGPAALVKSMVRQRSGTKHEGGSLGAVMRSLFGRTTGICRTAAQSGYISSHVGFDYRGLPPLFEAHGLTVARAQPSPLPWAWPGLNSQMVFVLHHVDLAPC